MSDKRLDSLPFPIFPVESPRLTFRHNFNLEASDANPNLGYDGGVLELSTDGGNTFQDILAAGGSFVMGGYNRTISTDRGSPIAGRQAWSGNSEGFITTVVNLPFIPPGGRLRWRMASDNSGSGEGWRVDTVNIAGCSPAPCPTPTPPPTATPGQIMLSAQGRVVQGINTVRLSWSGATSNQVGIYRNGAVIVTTANDGRHIDSTGDTGRARYRYRVCEAGTQNCSNVVTVDFPGGGTPTPTPTEQTEQQKNNQAISLSTRRPAAAGRRVWF